MLKASENPPALFPETVKITDLHGRWWVAHTKARFEKAFAWDLVVKRISYFLPMVARLKMSGGRNRRMVQPLFPSYVFFCGDESARYEALLTDRLCRVIEVPEQEKLVSELSSLHRVLTAEADLQPHIAPPAGQLCRITRGPFEGLEGIVLQTRAGSTVRLVLRVGILGQGASMEVDADATEVVGRAFTSVSDTFPPSAALGGQPLV